MRRPLNDLTLDIVVNIKPCLSVLPMSIVAFSSVSPYDLWIVRAHAIVMGICHRVPNVKGTIGMTFGSSAFQGGPL